MPGTTASPPAAVAILAPVLGSARARRVLWVLAAVLWALMVVIQIRRANPLGWLDLRVYRDSVHQFFDGRPLYDISVTEVGLPFTYPPVAVFLLAPLAWLPFPVAAGTLLVVNGAVLLATCWACLQPLSGGRPTLALAAATAGAALFLEPVWSALNFGQVDLLLTAAVTLDMLVIPQRFRGLLTGVLAAVKLTPLVFVLLLVLRRDWRSTARMLGTFVLLGLVAFAALPHESTYYWFHALRDPARIGPVAYVGNLSTYAVLERFWGDGAATHALWLALSLVVLVVTVVVVRRSIALGHRVLPLALVALAGLLCSPISWDHHWAWVVVLGFAMVELWTWSRPGAVLGLVLVAATAGLNPKWLDPAPEGRQLDRCGPPAGQQRLGLPRVRTARGAARPGGTGQPRRGRAGSDGGHRSLILGAAGPQPLHDPRGQGSERGELLRGHRVDEPGAHRVDVVGGGRDQGVPAVLGQDRVRAATVGQALLPAHQPGLFHPGDLVGQPALGRQRAAGEVGHAELSVGRLGQAHHHLVLGGAQAVQRLQVALEALRQQQHEGEPGPPRALLVVAEPAHLGGRTGGRLSVPAAVMRQE